MHGEYTSLLANSRGLVVSITPRPYADHMKINPKALKAKNKMTTLLVNEQNLPRNKPTTQQTSHVNDFVKR